MANALITFGGLPLLVGGTSLTADPRCCCYYYPPPPDDCPPCCVRIDWGEFNEDGDLIAEYSPGDETIGVTILMPTKFSRLVCDEESITVSWGVLSPDPPAIGAFARFGAAWGHSAESPEAEKVFPRGLVDWVDIESSEFSVTLQLSSCFLDAVAFLGYLTIGLDDPEWSIEIDVFRCENAVKCCPIEYDCEPCCFELADIATAILYEGEVWFVIENEAGYSLHVRVITTVPGLWCPGQSVQVEFDIIPPRWNPLDEYNPVATWGDSWLYDFHSPDIAIDGEVLTNRPPANSGKVDWGTQTETEFLFGVSAGCGELFCTDFALSPLSIVVNGLPGGSIGFSVNFDPCDEDFTDCCCPPHCECECYFPLSDDFCDTALVDEGEPSVNPDDIIAGLYETDGPTRISSLSLQVTADDDVYCNGTESEMSVTANLDADARHYANCVMSGGKMCPQSLFLAIKATDSSLTCPSPSFPAGITPPHYWILIDRINCNETNNVSVESFGDSLWRGEPEGPQLISLIATLDDCNRITGSGSFTEGGVNFNWTLTIELIGARDCPCEDT